MEIIEKVKETPKEYASKGVAGTALGIGIGGLALSLLNRNGLNLFGLGGNDTEKMYKEDSALQKSIYDLAILSQNERFSDRDTITKELFGLYKSQRDGFDFLANKQNKEAFALYKSQRDSDDAILSRIAELEKNQAIDHAVEPWKNKVLEMMIGYNAKAAEDAIKLEAERRCCADNKIVNYLNSNFYPVSIADITVGTTSVARTPFNPLCGCCNTGRSLF